MGSLTKLIMAMSLLLIVSIQAGSSYGASNFHFRSSATVTGIGAIMWVIPTHQTGDIVTDRWIFGNVTYQGTAPQYQAFIFDLENKTITCVGLNCFKNETAVKRGWHSIRVYLRNSGGENWSEQRYIFMNVSKEANQPLIVMDESEEGGADLNLYIIMILAGLTFVGFFYYRSQKKEEEEVEVGVMDQQEENP